MNVFTMFLNSMRLASKCESIGYKAGSLDSAAMIDELCEPSHSRHEESCARSDDALFDGPIAYPS
jgi:hypothetical protein